MHRTLSHPLLALTLVTVGCSAADRDGAEGGGGATASSTTTTLDPSMTGTSGASNQDGSSGAASDSLAVSGQTATANNGASSPQCSNFTACGGEPVGKWLLRDTCFEPITQEMACGDVTVSEVSQSGTMELRADGTLTSTALALTTLDYNFPVECFGVDDPSLCDTLGEALLDSLVETIATGTVECAMVGTNCQCQLEQVVDTVLVGTWSAADEKLLLNYDLPEGTPGVSEPSLDFCITGTTLATRAPGFADDGAVQLFEAL